MKTFAIHSLALFRLSSGSPGQKILEDERTLLEERLHKYLDQRCVVTIKGNALQVGIRGQFTKNELHHKACGVMRVWEWEAA